MIHIFYSILGRIFLGLTMALVQKSSPKIPAIPNLTFKVKKLHNFPYAGSSTSDIYLGHLILPNGKFKLVVIKTRRFIKQCHQKILREASIWNGLSHPNIAPFLGMSYDADRPNAPCLISYFCPRGNIAIYLRDNPLADKLHFATQIVAALCYLHDRHIFHGDIKSANVVVSDFDEALLIDFGSTLDLDTESVTLNGVGTSRWMAPELINPESEEGEVDEEMTLPPRLYFAMDIWALSMTILELFTGKIPFHYIHRDEAVMVAVVRGRRPLLPDTISPEIWAVLERGWMTLPAERPSARTLSVLLNIFSGLRRQNWPPLSLQKANLILNLLNEQDSGNGNSNSMPNMQPANAPYPCYWPGCHARFDRLVECQTHQVSHAFSM